MRNKRKIRGIRMKKKWKHSNSMVRGVLTAACAFIFFISCKSVCFAEATGKVKAPSVYIRQSADGNSEKIGSSSSGKTVTIVSQTTDSSGYVWYEVYVDANTTGYIRSDLLDVDTSSGTIPTSSSAAPAQSSEPAASTASGAEILPETGMDAQYATIKAHSAIVRSAASKTKSRVDSLPAGTQVIVSGQTEGTDMTWYYITFTGTNGVEKTGYVRSDLITLGEMVPTAEPEEQPQEEPEAQDPEPEMTVHQDYEVMYELDKNTGEYAWYIHDYTDPDPNNWNKQKVADVLTAAHARSVNSELDAETVSKQRIVIIVLIAVIIILAVVMTIMIFKLRDAYYEAYEEDEEEEDDEEEDGRRRRERERDREKERDRKKDAGDAKRSDVRRGEGRSGSRREDRDDRSGERRRERADREEPVRRKSGAREEKQPATRKRTAESDRRMPAREVSYEEEMASPAKTAPKKKAKNFLIDDDDFEFEFLNTKNKDRDI